MEFIDNTTPKSFVSYDAMANFPGKSVFKNMSDKTYEQVGNWLTMYYQNAYNTALMNYQNEYNSPLNQMLRYQEAGLNPFLASSDAGNMGQTHAGAAPRGNFTAPTEPQKLAAVNQSINSLNQTLKTAQGLYDYLQYGRPLQEINVGTAGINQNIAATNEQIAYYQSEAARSKALSADAQAAWDMYWNLGRSEGEDMRSTPRGVYMEQSTQRISSQIDQLKSLVDVLYPSQAAQNRAREALTSYQKEVMEGQNDAILHLDTGHPEVDAILKQVLFWLQNRLQVKI